MKNNQKRMYRIFTIADYKEEENFLRQQHQMGWKLIDVQFLCVYVFEKCEPEDYIYQLDFPDISRQDQQSYLQMFKDCGWEYIMDFMDWSYFRKKANQDEDLTIFSDANSKIEFINRIMKRRMLPILIIFLCCICPQIINVFMINHHFIPRILSIVFISLFLLYVYLIGHCFFKLRQMKKNIFNMDD